MTALLALSLALVQVGDPDSVAVLERINAHRKAGGLELVQLDPGLSRGCAAHARYLVTNVDQPSAQGLGLHTEDPKLPGYSREGERAGKAAVIFLGREGADAVDGWMGSLFHRIPLLESRLRKVGYGVARGGPAGVTVVLDATNGLGPGKEAPVIVYPSDGQKGVPLDFSPEIPDPIPLALGRKAGYPVTAIFSDGALVKDVKASIKDPAGVEIEVWLSCPERPAEADFQRNTVGLIPRQPLRPATTYTVTLGARVTGKAFQKTWSFSTRDP